MTWLRRVRRGVVPGMGPVLAGTSEHECHDYDEPANDREADTDERRQRPSPAAATARLSHALDDQQHGGSQCERDAENDEGFHGSTLRPRLSAWDVPSGPSERPIGRIRAMTS